MTNVYFQGLLHGFKDASEALFFVLLLLFSIQRMAVWKRWEVGTRCYSLSLKQSLASPTWKFGAFHTSHGGNRRHMHPVWTSSQECCLCLHVSSDLWCKPCPSQSNWFVLVPASYTCLVRVNHGGAYCVFSGQIS